jgi:hypothetical protein
MSDLAGDLAQCQRECEAAGPAALELRRLRRRLRRVLDALDKDVTDAIARHEAIEAPF